MADPANGAQTDLGDGFSQGGLFDLTLEGKEAKNLDTLLNNSLQSEPVQQAIREGLGQFALKKVASGSSAVSDAEAKELLGILAKLGDKAGDNVADQIKKTPEYKRLE